MLERKAWLASRADLRFPQIHYVSSDYPNLLFQQTNPTGLALTDRNYGPPRFQVRAARAGKLHYADDSFKTGNVLVPAPYCADRNILRLIFSTSFTEKGLFSLEFIYLWPLCKHATVAPTALGMLPLSRMFFSDF